MLWPKKNSYKNSCGSKIPLPPLPHNFSNGPSLKAVVVPSATGNWSVWRSVSALVWRGGENVSS